ncbi:Scr1 family TA system antitoxin-like transcriptional regulator [Streptomyces rubiginosohelvolus]|uniref:Scr1 family TA system antitoxin-like transcriptional regulator n=1 Tax=Streptomyces rubiginosohelvolus TaxID=67362 RepID=UPI00378AC6E8
MITPPCWSTCDRSGEHRYDVVLGEQALYTNIGGPEVMVEQIDRILRDIDLPSLTLGIIPAAAPVNMLPAHGFNLHADEVHLELVSSSVKVTGQSELGFYREAFRRLSDAALHGDEAKEILGEARSFWSSARRG